MSEPRRNDTELIKQRFEQALGKETSDLIFKTLRVVYTIDEQTIEKDRAQFEEKMRKILGSTTAEILLKKVFESY